MSKFKLAGGYTYDPDFLPADDDEAEEEDSPSSSTTPKRAGVNSNYALVIGDSQAEAPNGLGAALQRKLDVIGYTTTRRYYRGETAVAISDHLITNDYHLSRNPGLVIAIVGGNGSLEQTKQGVKSIIEFCKEKGAQLVVVGPGLATIIDDIDLAQRVFNNKNITTVDHWTSGPGSNKNDTRQAASDYIDDINEDGVYGYGIATNMLAGGDLAGAYTSQPDGVHIVNGAQKIAAVILEAAGIKAAPEDVEDEGTVADEPIFNSSTTGLDLRDPKNYESMTFSVVEDQARASSLKATVAAYKRNPAAFDSTFDTAGATHGIDPNFLRAIAAVESGFKTANNPSSRGALGLMQFMPDTATSYNLTDREDPVASIEAAAKMLAVHKRKYAANLPELAGTYNAGPGYGKDRKEKDFYSRIPRMDAYVGYRPETRAYMQLVMAAYHEFGGTGYL